MRVTWGGLALLCFSIACSNSSNTATGTSDAGTSAGDAGGDASSSSINDWSCVGHVTLPAPTKSTLSRQLQPIDVATAAKLPGTTVQLCASTDGPCATPVGTGTTDATTGIATISAPAGTTGFDGFWQTQPSGDVPNLLFNNIPILNDVQIDSRQSWSASTIKIVLGSSSAQWDQTKGIVGFQIQDCSSRFLHQDTDPGALPNSLGSGVSVTISATDSGIIAGYFLGDTLSTTATQTDSSGQGGFVNVPEGFVTLTAKVVATGQTIGTANVYSKAGALSGGVLAPSP